jgi:outer membrane lipoprotein-sorting protein
MKFPSIFKFMSLCALACTAVGVNAATTATEIVERAETLLWGKTVDGDFEMEVTTPSWSRSMSLKVLMDRPDKSFVRVTAPAKDAGIRSLRLGAEMWNYIPAIERTIKIPPSMMLQPWLGSDFTNDDLTKESSIVNDYTHKLLADAQVNGVAVHQVEALPKPAAPVVWGKLIYSVRHDFVPVRLDYFDEKGELIRTLTYSDVRAMDGRSIPVRWEMVPVNKPGKRTTIVVKAIRYDRPVKADVFSLRNLDRKD